MRACVCEAEDEPQRVATVVLHLVPAARCVLRAQHVRWRRRRELPQVSREPRARGEGSPCCRARTQDRPQTKTFVVHHVTSCLPACSCSELCSIGVIAFFLTYINNVIPSLCTNILSIPTAYYITLPYLIFGVCRFLHLPSAEAVSVRPNAQPRCNQKVTVIGREAEIGCEAEQITNHLGLVTCSMVVRIRRSALG